MVPACDTSGVKLSKATGQVTYKNKPLVGANIKFYAPEGPMAVAITDDQGNFSLTTNGRPGAQLGTHKVSISKMSGGAAATMPANPSPEDMRSMAMDNKGKPSGPKSEIPEKYSVAETSGLTAEVVASSGDNVFQFDLQ